MTPKEKAQDLVDKFSAYSEGGLDNSIQTIKRNAKQCALIAADEILDEIPEFSDGEYTSERMLYWIRVKQEIKKL